MIAAHAAQRLTAIRLDGWSRRVLIATLLAVITATGLGLRVGAVGSAPRVSVDERSYIGIANNMVVHRSYAYGRDPIHWAPGTPFFFATVMALTGTAPASNEPGSRTAVLYAQAALSAAVIPAVFLLASWLGGWVAGLGAALLAALYDPLVLAGRSLLSEPLGGLLLLLAATALVRLLQDPLHRRRWTITAGVLLGLLALTRNDTLVLVGVIPVTYVALRWRSEGRPAALRGAALMTFAALATLAPWLTYASIQRGRLTPVTSAGPSSLWVATYLPAGGRQIIIKRQFAAEVCRTFPDRPDACGVTATQMDMRLVFELLQRRHPGMTREQAVQAELDRNLREYALGQPLAYAGMIASKVGRLWGRPWGGGGIGRRESSLLEHRLFLGVAVLGLLAGLLRAPRHRHALVICAVALLTITAVNSVFVSESRMSLRMTPLLLAAGIGAVGAVINSRRRSTDPCLNPATPTVSPASS